MCHADCCLNGIRVIIDQQIEAPAKGKRRERLYPSTKMDTGYGSRGGLSQALLSRVSRSMFEIHSSWLKIREDLEPRLTPHSLYNLLPALLLSLSLQTRFPTSVNGLATAPRYDVCAGSLRLLLAHRIDC
jgi:hypothetical protein